MINPGNFQLDIKQGATLDYTWTWTSGGTVVNLTGCTARMQGRTSVGATTTIFSLTTENGGITLGGTAGTISILLTDEQTALITESGVYDIEIEFASGVVRRILEGAFILSPEVTR